jgi:hypothetical protein
MTDSQFDVRAFRTRVAVRYGFAPRWRGHLDLYAAKIRNHNPTIYEFAPAHRDDVLDEVQVVHRADGWWWLRVLGEMVAPYDTKSDAQRAAEAFVGF